MPITPKVLTLSDAPAFVPVKLGIVPLGDPTLLITQSGYLTDLAIVRGTTGPIDITGYTIKGINPITGDIFEDDAGSNDPFVGRFGFVNNTLYHAQPTDNFPLVSNEWVFASAPYNVNWSVTTSVLAGDVSLLTPFANISNFNFQRDAGGVYSFVLTTNGDLYLAEFDEFGNGVLYNAALYADGVEGQLFFSQFNTQISEGVNGYDFGVMTLEANTLQFTQFNKLGYGAIFDFELFALSFDDPTIDLTQATLAGSNGGYFYLTTFDAITGDDLLIEIDPTVSTYKKYDFGFEIISPISARRDAGGKFFITAYEYPSFNAFSYTFTATNNIGSEGKNALKVSDAIGLPCYSPCRPLIIVERLLK